MAYRTNRLQVLQSMSVKVVTQNVEYLTRLRSTLSRTWKRHEYPKLKRSHLHVATTLARCFAQRFKHLRRLRYINPAIWHKSGTWPPRSLKSGCIHFFFVAETRSQVSKFPHEMLPHEKLVNKKIHNYVEIIAMAERRRVQSFTV